MSSPSPNFLDRSILLQLAGPKVFARGEAYFTENRVRALQAAGDRASARVSGTRTYRAKLWLQRSELQHACTCAAGREEIFCKHCVALGLAWIEAMGETATAEAKGGPAAASGGSAAPETAQPQPRPIDEETGIGREQLRDYLKTLDKDRLINLTLEATDYDDILHRRLLLEVIGVARPGGPRRSGRDAAGTSGGKEAPKPDFDVYVHVLREAIECADYVDYHAMGDYAQGVEEAIKPLGDLLAAGHAGAVMELAEFALLELERSSDMIDTGDGSLSSVYDDLQRLHLEACRQANPDQEALAARLLEYELEGGLGVFNNAINTYAEVLGVPGVVAWRRRLVEEWSNLPPRGVSARRDGAVALAATEIPAGSAAIDYRRFQLGALMERLARSEGDTRALIAIKERDLSSGHDFLALAELYVAEGAVEEAARWAEKGLAAFPHDGAAGGLRDVLVELYARSGRHEEALKLLWEDFTRSGSLEDFGKLRAHVLVHAAGEWPGWRERVLEHLRGVGAEGRGSPADGSSRIVQVLLAEGLDAEALAEAKTGGCRPALWLEIAARREKTHPADALRIYQEQLGPTIARGSQGAYREAIDLLSRIGQLLEQLGRSDDFGAFRAEVRAANRQKRGFLKLLDGIKSHPPGKRRERND